MSERPNEDSTGTDPGSTVPSEAGGCEGCEPAKGGGRRGFLFAAGTTLLTVGGGLAAVPIVGVAIGPAEAGDPNRWISLGKATDFKVGQTVLVKFTNPWDSPTDGDSNLNVCYVRCLDHKKFQVFAITCAHLGCPVEWFAQSRLFMCPCHGGVYYEDGARASGPPPRGLYEYVWRVEDGSFEILGGRLPGLQEST